MARCSITRKLEFDAGHRIPSHSSKCRHLHGHRYVVIVEVTGEIQDERGESDDGMVIDFGTLKEVMNEYIVEKYDHKMLIYENDPELPAIRSCPGVIPVHFIPTAENMAREFFIGLDHRFLEYKASVVTRVEIFETPNCRAVYTREMFDEEHSNA
tara:strand:- start:2417 stop:2881 length:465 start_codon:yes stop_codon:yes gene_type:complete